MPVLQKTSFVLVLLFSIAFKPLHHGWSNYDQNKTLDYKGTVEESVYENPHATVRIKSNDDNVVWLVVLAPVTRMNARGVTADMIKKGATIQVVGYPHKETRDEMRAERIFVDGKKYELR